MGRLRWARCLGPAVALLLLLQLGAAWAVGGDVQNVTIHVSAPALAGCILRELDRPQRRGQSVVDRKRRSECTRLSCCIEAAGGRVCVVVVMCGVPAWNPLTQRVCTQNCSPLDALFEVTGVEMSPVPAVAGCASVDVNV